MRALLAIQLAICWAGPAGAAEILKHPKELQSLVDRVPLAPPELASDILIRIATSGKVMDRTWKMEMLEDSFQLAGHAAFPIRIVGAVPQARSTDSVIGVLWTALDEKLDALSLRCRIVHVMLGLDACSLSARNGSPKPFPLVPAKQRARYPWVRKSPPAPFVMPRRFG